MTGIAGIRVPLTLGPEDRHQDEVLAHAIRSVLNGRDSARSGLSLVVFPAHRTEFVVDLPMAEPSTSPAGLRLIV